MLDLVGLLLHDTETPMILPLVPMGAYLLPTLTTTIIRVMNADGSTGEIYAGNLTFAGNSDGNANSLTSAGARFRQPRGVTVAADGRVFLADTGNHRIRVVTADGSRVSTYAGIGSGFFDGDSALARFNTPTKIAWLPDGRLLVADSGNDRIRIIEQATTLTARTVSSVGTIFSSAIVQNALFDIDSSLSYSISAGNDSQLFAIDNLSGAIRLLRIPTESEAEPLYQLTVTLQADGEIANLPVEIGFAPISNFTPAFTLTTTAITLDEDAGTTVVNLIASSDDGDPAIAQTLTYTVSPLNTGAATLSINSTNGVLNITTIDDAFGAATITVTVDDGGNVNNRFSQTLTLTIRPIADAPRTAAVSGIVRNYAGNGVQTPFVGGSAISAQFDVNAMAVAPDGSLFVGDNRTDSVYVIDANGSTLSVFNANSGINQFTQRGLAVTNDGQRVLAVEISRNEWIRSISTEDSVVYAGTGAFGAADGPSTTVATFGILGGIALDAEGALFIGSQSQPIIRMVSTDGATVSTVAGVNGEAGSTNGPIADARLSALPVDIATAPDGRVFIADGLNNRIRVINAARTEVSTYAGTGAQNRRNGAALTEAQINRPVIIALAPDGRLFFVAQDTQNLIRVVSADGATVSNYAGGSGGLVNGPVHSARFNSISDLVFAPDGRLFISSNNRIRVIEEAAQVSLSGTVQRAGAIALQSNFTQSLFFDPDNLENPGSGINLTYAIVGGNGNGLFTINTDNGEISLTTTPAEGEAGSYTLTIAASNAAGTATATTTITLEEIDNFPPIFALSTNDLILDEEFGSSAITIASSNDGDPDVEQTLTYSLDDAYDTNLATLTIDPNSGVVTISSIENAFGVATIAVIATDSSGASSTQPFTLTVNPVNDIPQLLSGLLVRTYAGSGNAGSDNGTIHQASFTEPYGIAVVNDGNVVISENNFALRIINPNSGTVSDYSIAAFQQPAGLDFSPALGASPYSRPGVFLVERTRNRVRRYDSVIGSALASFENFTPYNRPRDVAYDPDNRRLFVADTDNHRIQVIEDVTQSALITSVYAGSSSGTAGAIDGPAAAARFRSPTSIALAPDGRLFVTDSGNNLIRVISTDGTTVSTYAGDASSSTIDYLDGSTSTARFNLPYGIAVATDGRVFVADRDNHSIRLIDAEGSTVSTYAGGNGNESVINGLASNATFNNPTSIAIDAQGRVLVTDLSNHLIRSIEQGSLDESVSEPFLSAAEQTTGAIVLDAATIQGLFIDADSDTLTYSLSNNNANAQTLFAISSTNGAITLAAIPSDRQQRESILTITASDQHGGAATASITVLLEDRNDPPTFTLSTSRLDLNEDFGRREVTITSSDDGDIFATQTLSYSLSHSADSVEVAIDPQSGTITIISIPNANSTNTISVIATDSAGGVSTQTLTIAVAPVADPLTAVQSVRAVSTYAGDGNRANDNGSTTTASFNNPYGIVVATDGRLFVSDQDGHQIRVIDPTGSTVSTYSGRAGNPGTDLGDAAIGQSQYRQPTGLARTGLNFLYVADRGNHCIRFLIFVASSPNTGSSANHFSGECGDANASSLSEPRGVAVNPANGRIFVADSNNHRIRLLSTGGDITNSIGDGISGFADGSAATARFNTPIDVIFAPDGRVFVADSNNHRIRVISADLSTVSTYAGEGISGFVDGSAATALFDTPSGLALAEDGRLFVVDRNNHSIRVISADGNTVSTYAGDGSSGMNNAFGDAARFNNPLNAAIDADGRLFVTDSANHRIRLIEEMPITRAIRINGSRQLANGVALDAQTVQSRFQDPDDRDLEYSIIAGNQDGLFSINQDNGTISFTAITTEEQAGTYTLTIQANDDSDSATNTITLFLEPLDNYPPSFSLSEDAMSLAEDFGTATLSIVNPDDGDSLSTQTLNYSFSSDKALTFAQLAIDPVSGTLTITSLADAFGGPLSITITATDSSGATAIQTFTLTVTPVNDPPVVVQSLPVVSTYAGNGSAGNVLGSTATAQFSSPYGIGIATDGRVFVADRGNNRVRVIDAAGSAVTTYNDTDFPDMRGLDVAADGQVYVVHQNRLRIIGTDGSLTTYGDGGARTTDGFSQGASSAVRARFFRAADVAVAPNGTVFITESSGQTIRLLSNGNGYVGTYAGTGNFGFDDGSRGQASFASPTGITVAADGRIFSMDSQTRVRVRLTEGNTVSTYAGGNSGGSQDGTANNARFGQVSNPGGNFDIIGLAISTDGRLFVADRANHRIRVISADGNVVSTYMGSSRGNSNGIAAQFNAPTDIEIAPDGRIFVADTDNHRIQVITETPIAELATTTLSTAEQQVAGTQLLSASVIQRLFRDPDGDSLSYAITGGNQDGRFALQNGNLVLSNSIVEGQAGDYAVVLEARESGDNAGVATTTWAVRIEPLDNYPPIFTLSTTALTLTEDFESAVQVSVVNPSDGDSGVEQTLTYSAHTDDVVAAIAIDSQSGTITLNSVANAFGETAITVVATDSSGASTLRVLNLSITPVIDPVVTAPILIARTYAGSGSNGSDNGAALEASFSFPYGIAVAPDGRVFVSENAGHRIRMISADGATVSTYAGDGFVLNQPAGLSLAPDGRLFIADSGNNRIRVVSADGNTLSTYAEGGLNSPRAVALNADGRLFIADFNNHLIRTASPDGTISTYAGDGTAAFNDGSTATAQFDVPADLAVRPNGSLLVADRDNHRIRSINAGNVSTFAGNGETEVLNQPFGIALAADGGVFVLDRSNQRIRLLSRDGSALNTYAGSGVAGFKDGLALEAEFNNPTHIATAPDGRLFVVDFGNHRIRVIEESTNAITLRTVSGSEQEADSTLFQAQTLFINADGDDLNYRLISVSNDGEALFTIDSDNGRVSPLTTPIESQAGTYTLVIEASHAAGATTAAVMIGLQPLDNYPPIFTLSTTTANIKQGEDTLQISVTASDDGDSGVDQAITYSISRSNVSFATLTISENSGLITISNVPDTFGREATVSVTATDSSGASSVQSIVIRGYIISRFAQSASVYAGSGAFGRDDGSTTTARFDTPRGLAYAADGRLFVADSVNDRIRVIDANGSTVSTYAGSFFGSDDGSTTTASFDNPRGLALAADGRLFVADDQNNLIRVIDANGSIVSTYAGTGLLSSDDGSTTTATFAAPTGLALAADGRLFVSDRGSHIIRVINANGSIVSTYAGTGGFSFVFDGSTTTATFNAPRGLALAADGRLFVADDQNRLIRVVDANGSTVSTYAGGIGSFNGGFVDGSTATARFNRPFDVLQAGKTLFVADGANQAVRVIDASGTVSTLLLENNLLGVNLGTPLGLAISTDGRRVFISHSRNQIIVVNTGNTVPTLTLSQNSLSLQSGFSPQTIGVTVADADDNDQVVISVSGNTLGLLSISTAADSITLSNAGTANGQITLTVSAIDSLGATASERLTVTISGGSGGGSSGGGGDSSGGGGGGGGGCSLQSATNHPIDTTLWWLLLLSLALLTVRAYTTRRPQKSL